MSKEETKIPTGGRPTLLGEMVAISAALPVSKLETAVTSLLQVADSAVLTIAGNADHIASSVTGLGAKFNVKSARLSLRGGPAK